MSEPIRRIRANQAFSEVVVFNNIAHISGQVDYRQSRTVQDQAARIFAFIDQLLAEAGTCKENLLHVNVYLANPGDFEEMNREWKRWLDTENVPARTVLQSQFSNPGWLIKVSAVAAVPDEK